MSTEIKASLVRMMNTWIEDHASNEDFNWTQYWVAGDLHERMGAAAYAVFMASREAQDFAKEREKESA